MKREFKVWAGLVAAMALSAIVFGQTVSISGRRVMSGIVGTPADGQIAVWSAASSQWVTGSALTSTAVNTNGSITIFGSTQDTGFTITNNANGSYRWSLPAVGSSGQYGFNFSGTNVTLTAIAAGVAGSDTQVQFNDGGSLAGDAGLVYDKTTHALTTTGSVVGHDVNATASGDGFLVLTNSARTHTAKIQIHGTATGDPILLTPAAPFSGFFYWGNSGGTMTPVAATNTGVGSIVLDQTPTITTPQIQTSFNFNGDTPVTRESAAVVQLGADSATAVAQTVKAPDGSGTDKVGGALTLQGGQGTGTGRAGDVIFRTAPSSTTGSSANAYAERYHASAKHVVLTEATATTFVNITCASGKSIAGEISASVNADDGTNFQMQENNLKFAAVNKAGTITATIDTVAGTVATSSGTLTPVTFTIVANGASVDIKVAATSSLSQTTLNCEWAILALNGNAAAVVTAQ